MNPLALAVANLRHHRVRTAIALGGVGAVVLLVFMQLGFLGSVDQTATLVYDALEFDLLMTSSEYRQLAAPGSFPRDRLAQAHGVPGVLSVCPVTTSAGLWRGPKRVLRGGHEVEPGWSIMLLAIEPGQLAEVFPARVTRNRAEEFSGLLRSGDAVLIDRRSRPEYGDDQTWTPTAKNFLNDRPVKVAGRVEIGTGFGHSALLVLSEGMLADVNPFPPGRVTLGLVRVAPGQAPERVAEALGAALPADVRVRTRARLEDDERRFWASRTAVGHFFLAGVVVGLAVGGVFVYQMMAADINKNLPEYATIKALGYPPGYLTRVVYAQGALLAVVGYVPGLGAALVLYVLAGVGSGIPIAMTAGRMALVFGLTLGMCLLSARAAVRIVHRADPADLFS